MVWGVGAWKVVLEFSQDELRDKGQVEFARPIDRHPLNVTEFGFGPGKIVSIEPKRGCIGQEKPCIVAARMSGWRKGAKEEAQGAGIRQQASLGKVAPWHGRVRPEAARDGRPPITVLAGAI